MSSNIRLEKTCQHCSKNFTVKTTVKQYCSDNCAKRAYKDRIRSKKIEVAIQKEFEQKPFNPIVNQKEFLSVKETCQLIGASRWTIYRFIDGGSLKASKLGSRTIIGFYTKYLDNDTFRKIIPLAKTGFVTRNQNEFEVISGDSNKLQFGNGIGKEPKQI